MHIELGNTTRARIIDGVIGQLSDGKWEDSPAMCKYWENASTSGTELITIDNWNSGFYCKNEEWIKHWFAKKLKAVVQDEVGNNKAGWNRNNMEISDYISYNHDISVSQCYECYDYLLGRTGHKYAFQTQNTDPGIEEFKELVSKTINDACENLNLNTATIAFDDWVTSILCFFEDEFDHFKDSFDEAYFKDLHKTLAEKDELVWPKFEAAAQIMKTMLYDNSDMLKDATQEYGLSMAPDDCFKAVYYKNIRPVLFIEIYSYFNVQD